MSTVRTSISIKKEILDLVDKLAKELNTTRSHVITSAIESYIMDKSWVLGKDEDIVCGVLIVLYETGHYEADTKLTILQHQHDEIIRASMHIHVSKTMCMEIIAVKGKLREVKELANQLEGLKGVLSLKYCIYPVSEEEHM
ncbi:MAG: CopG family ribbon-helix-helix protein [Crenarchaeota archaeon]|nr:CopG family ribbon-helix-helix protein [Thermoproteota archaeon]